MKSDLKLNFNLKRYVKLFAIPLTSAVVITVLILMILKLGYGKVTANLKDLDASKTEKEILENKINILKQIKNSNLIKADISYVALPDKNPGAWLVYHIKKIAEKYSIVLENISFSQVKDDDKTKLKTTEVEIEFKSPNIEPINNFLAELIKVAPIVSMKDADIITQDNEDVINASAKLNIYWSDLPTKLPDLIEPLTGLSELELKTLGEVSTLTQPSFTDLNPAQNNNRDTPFN